MNNTVPTFKSYDEEAAFWDTHSVTDFLDELKPVEVRVEKNLSHIVPVRFDANTVGRLRSLAASRGIGPTTLVRMWVMERLAELDESRTSGISRGSATSTESASVGQNEGLLERGMGDK